MQNLIKKNAQKTLAIENPVGYMHTKLNMDYNEYSDKLLSFSKHK